MTLADQIAAELERLEVSTSDDLSSGLSVEATDEAGQVRIYDRYVDGNYAPHQVLEILRSLEVGATSLESEAVNNIWQLIAPAEF